MIETVLMITKKKVTMIATVARISRADTVFLVMYNIYFWPTLPFWKRVKAVEPISLSQQQIGKVEQDTAVFSMQPEKNK